LLLLILCIHQVTIYLISARSRKPFAFNLLPLALRPKHSLTTVLLLLLATCALCLVPMGQTAFAANITMAWDSNQEPDIAGYRLHYGTSSGNYSKHIDVGNTIQHTITGLQAGVTYYFAATAYDSNDLESAYSEELVYTTPKTAGGNGKNANIDSDNDGMPDEWETLHDLDPLQDDASQDSDGDGISNLWEYLGGTDPHIFEQYFEPDTPAPLSPSNDDIVSLTPVLKADAFHDPDVYDVHTASQWQIFRASDNVCVFDKLSRSSLTTLNLPKLVLEENTDYVWQVRYLDNHGLASDWSESGTFTTGDNVADADHNGIPDDQEVATDLDLDEDGMPDIGQNDIKCVEIQGESAQIGISIRQSDLVQSIAAIESESLADLQQQADSLNQPANLPYGLISFKLIVDQPGDEVVVTLHLSEAAPADSAWYKYDPVEDVWYDYSAYTEFGVDRKTIYLTLVDGGDGDADGIANGIIVDPLGLGVASSLAGVSGGGSGGACFISAASKSIKITEPAAIRQKLAELAFVLTLLLVIFILARCLKNLISHRVR